MTILGLAGVLFYANEQAHTKWIIVCSEENTYLDAYREARGALKVTVGNGVQPKYHSTDIVFCSFLFFSTRVLCPLVGYAQKQASTHIGHCRPKALAKQ